jgi:hypothetical protein
MKMGDGGRSKHWCQSRQKLPFDVADRAISRKDKNIGAKAFARISWIRSNSVGEKGRISKSFIM